MIIKKTLFQLALFLFLTIFPIMFIFVLARTLYTLPDNAIRFQPAVSITYPDKVTEKKGRAWFIEYSREKSFHVGLYSADYTLEYNPSLHEKSNLYLVLPGVGGSALRVMFNGAYIGSQGDVHKGQSNIWNSAKLFHLPSDLLRDENTLRLELYGLYEAGVIKEPYLIERAHNNCFLWFLHFFSQDGIWALCGGLFVLGLSFFLIGIQTLPDIDSRTILGLTTILSSFFMLDFVTFDYLAISVVDFKRALVIARHLSALLFVLGYTKLLDIKLDPFGLFFIGLQILLSTLLFIPQTMVDLKNLYLLTYIGVTPLMFYLFFLVSRTIKKNTDYLILLTGIIVAIVCVIRDIVSPFIYQGVIYISQYGFLYLLLTTSLFLVMDFARSYKQLYIERKKAQLYRKASFHDPLTQVFNRNILPHIIKSLQGVFSIIAVDLNDFKGINDSYGHAVGDMVLQDLAKSMEGVFRRDDFIIRTGGDEFVIILPGCPSAKTEFLVNKLQEVVAQSSVIPEPGDASTPIHYSISIGCAYNEIKTKLSSESFNRLLHLADTQMYSHKRCIKTESI